MPPMHTKLPFASAQLWPSGAPGQVVQVIGWLLNATGSSKLLQPTAFATMRAVTAAVIIKMNHRIFRGMVPPFRGLPRWLWGRAPRWTAFLSDLSQVRKGRTAYTSLV